MKLTKTVPGILTVAATDRINVAYDAALNIVEVRQGSKVIRSEVCPRNYSAAAFVETLSKVRNHYLNL